MKKSCPRHAKRKLHRIRTLPCNVLYRGPERTTLARRSVNRVEARFQAARAASGLAGSMRSRGQAQIAWRDRLQVRVNRLHVETFQARIRPPAKLFLRRRTIEIRNQPAALQIAIRRKRVARFSSRHLHQPFENLDSLHLDKALRIKLEIAVRPPRDLGHKRLG